VQHPFSPGKHGAAASGETAATETELGRVMKVQIEYCVP
jgi:hypothetical protein